MRNGWSDPKPNACLAWKAGWLRNAAVVGIQVQGKEHSAIWFRPMPRPRLDGSSRNAVCFGFCVKMSSMQNDERCWLFWFMSPRSHSALVNSLDRKPERWTFCRSTFKYPTVSPEMLVPKIIFDQSMRVYRSSFHKQRLSLAVLFACTCRDGKS